MLSSQQVLQDSLEKFGIPVHDRNGIYDNVRICVGIDFIGLRSTNRYECLSRNYSYGDTTDPEKMTPVQRAAYK